MLKTQHIVLVALVALVGLSHALQFQTLNTQHVTFSDEEAKELSLVMHQDILVVGNPLANKNVGAVYVFAFQNGMWTRVANLSAPHNTSGAEFGRTLDVDDTHLVVAAPGEATVYVFTAAQPFTLLKTVSFQDKSKTVGAVHVAGNNMLVQLEQSFVLATGKPGADWTITKQFDGYAAGALDTDVIALGNPAFQSDDGSVIVFVWDQHDADWKVNASFGPSDKLKKSRFGSQIAISGGKLLVRAGDQKASPSSVYMYNLNQTTGQYDMLIRIPPSEVTPRLGEQMDLSGSLALLASPEGTPPQALLYVFATSETIVQWYYLDSIQLPFNRSANPSFAMSVAINAKHLVVANTNSLFAYDYCSDTGEDAPEKCTNAKYPCFAQQCARDARCFNIEAQSRVAAQCVCNEGYEGDGQSCKAVPSPTGKPGGGGGGDSDSGKVALIVGLVVGGLFLVALVIYCIRKAREEEQDEDYGAI